MTAVSEPPRLTSEELTALDAIKAALAPLDPPARERVLRWAWQRFVHEDTLAP